LAAEGKAITPGGLVAALTFGYWTAFFGTDYEEIWRRTLHPIARQASGKSLRRKDFASQLTPIRVLRNRIAHHEPILTWNLPKHYDSMLRLTEWLSPAAAAWCQTHCRFCVVYPSDGICLEQAQTNSQDQSA